MKAIKLIIFLFLFIFTVRTYGMQDDTNNPLQCTLAHAPNNSNLVVLCEPKTIYLYNPHTHDCTTIPAKNNNTYHSIAANNDLIAIQTTKGLRIYHQNHTQKIKKTWHPNLGTTCHNQIALFPDDNDTLVAHNVNETETTITHSIAVHSINSSHKFTSFCERFDKSDTTKNITLKPLIACHPNKKQIAFKLDNSTLVLHNILPASYAELAYLLHDNENPQETSFAQLPTEIRKLIAENLILSLGIKWVTKKLNIHEGLTDIFSSTEYSFIEYSPDGSLIVAFCHSHFSKYDIPMERNSQCAYYKLNDPQACIAFYPSLCPIVATLFNSGAIYCSDHYQPNSCKSPTIQLHCNETIPSGAAKKIMAFSGDGKILYIAKGNELIKHTISDETVEKIKQL